MQVALLHRLCSWFSPTSIICSWLLENWGSGGCELRSAACSHELRPKEEGSPGAVAVPSFRFAPVLSAKHPWTGAVSPASCASVSRAGKWIYLASQSCTCKIPGPRSAMGSMVLARCPGGVRGCKCVVLSSVHPSTRMVVGRSGGGRAEPPALLSLGVRPRGPACPVPSRPVLSRPVLSPAACLWLVPLP